jgi:hypothetical protein
LAGPSIDPRSDGKGRSAVVTRVASPILVALVFAFLGGLAVRAEPPIALRSDELAEEEAQAVSSSHQSAVEHAVNREQELQAENGVMHRGGPTAHERDFDTYPHASDSHLNDPDMHHHESVTGEHVNESEGMGGRKAADSSGGMHGGH